MMLVRYMITGVNRDEQSFLLQLNKIDDRSSHKGLLIRIHSQSHSRCEYIMIQELILIRYRHN